MRACVFEVMVLAALTLSTAGCAAEEPGDADAYGTANAAASAPARRKLEDMTGRWRVSERSHELSPMPEHVRVIVTDEAVDPTTGTTKGTRLRIMRDDDPVLPAIDRAPFVDVDEGKSCESVSMGGASGVSVCHTTVLAGDVLRHEVKITSYAGYIIPTGWQTAVQTLAKKDDGSLRYTYTIDGELYTDVTMTRP